MADEWIEQAATAFQARTIARGQGTLAANAPAPGDDWLDSATQAHRQRRDAAANTSVRAAVESNPSSVVEARKSAHTLGVAPDIIERNPEFKLLARQQEIHAATADAPRTREAFGDPEFAKIAHPDAEQLGVFERWANSFKKGALSLGTLGEVTGYSIDRALTAIGEVFLPPARSGAKLGTAQSQSAEAGLMLAAQIYGKAPTDPKLTEFTNLVERTAAFETTGAAILDGTGYLAKNPDVLVGLLAEQVLPMAVLAPVGGAATLPLREALVARATSEAAKRYANTAVPLAGVQFTTNYGLVVGAETAEGLEQGMTPPEAIGRASTKGGVEGVVNMLSAFIPLPSGATRLGKAAIVGTEAVKQGASGVAGATAGAGAVGEQITLSEQMLEFFGEMTTAPIDLAMVALSNPNTTEAGQQEAVRVIEEATRARDAQRYAEQLGKAGEIVQGMNLTKLSPEELQKALARLAHDAGDVYLSVEELRKYAEQRGITPDEIIASMPSAKEQYAEATSTRGDLRIPVSEYVAGIAPTEHADLTQHVRSDPHAMSAAEAEAWTQTFGQEMKATIESLAATPAAVEELKAKADQLGEQAAQVEARWKQQFAPVRGESKEAAASRRKARDAAEAEVKAIRLEAAQARRAVRNAERAGVAEVRSAAEKSADQVAKMVRDQIMATGRHDSTAASKMAALHRAFALTLGQQLGISPEEVYRKFALQVQGTRPAQRGAQTLDQGRRGQIAMAEDITLAPSILTLFENADLSTFLHESGHFFFEAYRAVASTPDAPQTVIDDMAAILRFVGVESLDTWNAMSAEERRAGHEKVAEAFEVYLFEGKAPSRELQSAFAAFRSWLTEVYKAAKEYLSPSKIDPEIRSVFDRMLASEKQIAVSKRRGAFDPLFASADEAGMSPTEWEEYQALEATRDADAIRDLEARSLRDMRWLTNAKGRELRRLQAEAKATRESLREAAEQEVFSDPVQQAAYFLARGVLPANLGGGVPSSMKAGKLDIATVAAMYGEREKPKTNPDVVDPRYDDLLTAIAKLGGVSSEEAKLQGLDKALWGRKSRINTPVFGKRVFRGEGRSFDAMAEALSQDGYLPSDYTANLLLDKISTAVAGGKVYSAHADPIVLDEPVVIDPPNWRGLARGRYGLLGENGLDPNEVANWFGIDSGDALVRGLVDVRPAAEEIEAVIDREMLRNHAELSSPEDIEKAANAALSGEAHRRLLATELKKLSAITGTPAVLDKAAQEYADAAIARRLVRDLKPKQFTAAEFRAAREAETHLLAGKKEEAAQAKRTQILNAYLYRSAMEAEKDIAGALEYFKKFDNPDILKNIAIPEQDVILSLLAKYDLRKSTTLREIDALAHFKAYAEEGNITEFTAVDEKLLSEASKKSYKNLTVEELRGLQDAIKMFETVGRNQKKLIAGAEQFDFDTAKGDMLRMAEEALPKTIESPIDRATLSAMEKLKGIGRKYNAPLVKVEQLVQFLDGNTANGPWQRFLFDAAANAEAKRNQIDAKALYEIVSRFENLDATRLKQTVFIPAINQSLTIEGVMTVALNMGTESNKYKMQDPNLGYGWTDEQLTAIIAHLTPKEFDTIQGIWDVVGSLWPSAVEVEQAVTGLTPKGIAPRTFISPHGQPMRGGYFPVVYDRAQPVGSAKLAEAAFGKVSGETGLYRPRVADGFTKQRVTGAAGRINITDGLSQIPSHLAEVSHLIAYKRAMRDINKILFDPEISQAIKDRLGVPAYDQFLAWANALANNRASMDDHGAMPLTRILNALRRNTSLAFMAFKYTTGAAQLAGIFGSAEIFTQRDVYGRTMGVRYLSGGVGEFSKNPAALYRFVTAKSAAMADRVQSFDADVRHNYEVLLGKEGTLAYTRMLGMKLIGYADMAVALPTWKGAYDWALDQGFSEQEAVSHGDKTVRLSQGAGGIKDMTAAQRAAGWRWATMFFSYFATYHGRLNSILRDYTNPNAQLQAHRQIDAALRTFTLVVLASTISEILAMRWPKCEESKDAGEMAACMAGWAAGKSVAYTFAGIPVVRDIANAVEAGRRDVNTPLLTVGKELTTAFNEVAKVIDSEAEANPEKLVRSSMKSAAYLAGVPGIAQLDITAGYAFDLYTGDEELETPWDARFFLVHKPKEE